MPTVFATRNSIATAHVRAKRERRRGEILHAALRAFREKGFHGTTLDDIATHVGVRKTALYHYFPDKQAILHECHRESLGELQRILSETRAIRGASPKLAHVIREHVRVMTETLQGSPLAFEVTSFSPARQRAMIRDRDRYEHGVRRIIERGIRSGELRRVDAKLAAFAILGAINWIARWYRPEGELHARELGEAFVAQLLDGLRQPGARGTAPRSGANSSGNGRER
jgi:AcrR family transcriptional regulator